MECSTQPRRTPKALLERLDLCERSTLRQIGNEFRVPGYVFERDDLAISIGAWLIDNGRLDDAHTYLDQIGVA